MHVLKLPDRYPVKGSALFGKRIVGRTEYWMQGDKVVPSINTATAFDQSVFLHNENMPFEVIKMVPFIDPLSDDDPATPLTDNVNRINFGSLGRYVQLAIQLKGITRPMTKSPSRLSAILAKDTYDHEFLSPLYFEASQGFDITVTHSLPIAIAAGGIRMEIGFMGYLLELE
jgi:hypothetical protein